MYAKTDINREHGGSIKFPKVIWFHFICRLALFISQITVQSEIVSLRQHTKITFIKKNPQKKFYFYYFYLNKRSLLVRTIIFI